MLLLGFEGLGLEVSEVGVPGSSSIPYSNLSGIRNPIRVPLTVEGTLMGLCSLCLTIVAASNFEIRVHHVGGEGHFNFPGSDAEVGLAKLSECTKYSWFPNTQVFLVPQYPTFKPFRFLHFSSNLPGLFGVVSI